MFWLTQKKHMSFKNLKLNVKLSIKLKIHMYAKSKNRVK